MYELSFVWPQAAKVLGELFTETSTFSEDKKENTEKCNTNKKIIKFA